jgi:phospholipid transport system transporter-binding protein
MSDAVVSMAEPGVLCLAGVLDYSGPACAKGKALIAASGEQRLVLDCSAVVKSSSVGCRCCWLHARCPGGWQGLRMRGMPADMRKLPRSMTSMKCWPVDGPHEGEGPRSASPVMGFAGEGLFCMMADPRALGAD